MNQTRKSTGTLQTGLKLTAAGVLALSLLAACGGGGGSGSPATSSTPPTTPASPTSIGGTVAVGDALVGANVTLIDATGKNATATSTSNGNYSIPLAGLTAPFLIVATDPSGVNAPLYSVTASVPTGSSTPLVANVTPLTTAVAAELTSDGNPLDLTSPTTLAAQVTPTAVSNAVTTLNTLLAQILSADGVSGSSFNPISTTFTPNQTGPDAVIDSVVVSTSPSGGTQIASIAAPGTAVSLNSATTSSSATQIAAPAIQANYLQSLVTELSSCLSGTTSACSSAIDTHYLENGYSSTNGGFQTFHPDISAAGSTITGVKTLAYWEAGLSPFGISNPAALVRILYTNAAGQQNFALTVVQQTQAATTTTPAVWDIIGNQQAYDVTIDSFVTQRQFLDSADATGSRYESGLNISIPVNSAAPVNPSNVGSVNVTGPGLPAGGVWLEPRSATGNDTLALASRTVTSAPTTATTSSSNTTLYRWSWQALPSDASTFAFTVTTSEAGYYAPTALTAQTLPSALATYSVTFYNATGAAINSSPVTVLNSTTPLSANAAAGVAWQTLGNDVISSFLNPSSTLAGAQTSAAIDWSGLVNGVNIAPLLTGVEIQDNSTTEVDGWWKGSPTAGSNGQFTETVTAGVAQNGTQTCTTACPFPALQTGGSRLVELNWGADGVSYYNIWKYND
jgi:hypothetical protein